MKASRTSCLLGVPLILAAACLLLTRIGRVDDWPYSYRTPTTYIWAAGVAAGLVLLAWLVNSVWLIAGAGPLTIDGEERRNPRRVAGVVLLVAPIVVLLLALGSLWLVAETDSRAPALFLPASLIALTGALIWLIAYSVRHQMKLAVIPVVCALLPVLVALAGVGLVAYRAVSASRDREMEVPPEKDPEFVSDNLSEKRPRFDPDLVDSRRLGGWEVNASAAVIGLDCPRRRPEAEPALFELRASYAAAAGAAASLGEELLPSANMIDGKAKQFDDGLYAALDLAAFRGELGLAPAAPAFVAAVYRRLPHGTPAGPFLAAALELAGEKAPLEGEEEQKKRELLARFDEDEFRSKPISFYTWTKELGRLWRFSRFLQEEFGEGSLTIPRALAAVLRAEPELLAQYRSIIAFYGRLTNPSICLSVDLLENGRGLEDLAAVHGARRQTVAFFPPSTSRETELFDGAYDGAVPAEANLMSDLVRRIRSGEVNLAPGSRGGWYQHQVYALETLLLPTRGQEKDKLLLSADYKRRLLAAFKALLTKRRETHARQLAETGPLAAPPPPRKPMELKPRLRLEPLASFYLRTARAYTFLEGFLEAAVGRTRLASLRGLREGGLRGQDLAEELATMRRLFYGFYLVTCEDIGMKPQLAPDEPVDEALMMADALVWLGSCRNDPDLANDTRVSVPIARDLRRQVTRVWATLGIRLAKLEADYAMAPVVRPAGGKEWKDPYGEMWRVVPSTYLIPVDEFAELELKGASALTRRELRAICDRRKTREKILERLSR